MGDKKIIIDLSQSMNARSFKDTDIIHKAEFNKVKKLINGKIEKIKELGNNDSEIIGRYNDTITILGTRGSGKTSFLMSVLHYCEKEKYKDIEVIELIDPTLIEEKGHIFLTLISLIADKVNRAISKNECDPYCKEYRQRRCWEDKLKKLAAGLPAIEIDNVSLYSNWHDPEHVMRRGLEAVKSAKELEKNFNKIIAEALKILGKKVFLIAFDDIDVNFNNGWKVLETIRKYLTSPKVITLLSGDIKLFSKAIRKHQWINFGEELLKNEGERLKYIERYDELVTEIEGQYMQKIMKAPNRIHLLTIGEKLNEGSNIFIGQDSEDNITIYEYYANFLRTLGLQNKYDIHTINTYLLGLPLRTQVQILKQFKEIENGNLSILNITDAFVSDLYESGVNVELAKSQPKDFCNITHKFLLQKELLNETYQLLPTSESANYNAVLFSLYTMFIAHARNNPSILFEYWVAIATIKNLLTILPYRSDQKKDTALFPSIEGVSDYSFIGQNKVYRDICSYLSTYIRATLNNGGQENKTPWGGTLIIKGLAEYAKKSLHATQDRIDVVFKGESLIRRQLAFFPISIASYAHKQQSIVIYSFYTLLGTIVELLKRYNVIKPIEEVVIVKKRKEIINDIHVLLKELSQVKYNVMPVFERTTNSSEQEPIFNTLEEEKEDNDISLAEKLYDWIISYPNFVPPHLVGKIATRAFYAMRNLDDIILKDEEPNLGDAMHRRIVIVMNSALIEDAKEHLMNFNLSNNNPLEKDTIFIENLKNINKSPENTVNLKFSSWLISCPLFGVYLNLRGDIVHNEEYKHNSSNNRWWNLVKFLYRNSISPIQHTTSTIRWCINNSIYEKLKQVSIYGSKNNSTRLTKFSLAKRSIASTIDILANIYETPYLFFKDDIDNILNKLLLKFKNEHNLKEKVLELKRYCNSANYWGEIVVMIRNE